MTRWGHSKDNHNDHSPQQDTEEDSALVYCTGTALRDAYNIDGACALSLCSMPTEGFLRFF